MGELVEIQPRELKFTFELKKQSSCLMRLSNKTDEYVAFKVKTTCPKRYCVQPNTGIIQPRSACNFTVIMQAQRTAPPDMQLKDKFLVQSTVVPYGSFNKDIFPTFFSKENGSYIEECKLRVVLVSPLHSPIPEPFNGTLNEEPTKENPILKESFVLKDSPVGKEPPVMKESPGVKEFPIVKEAPSFRVALLDDKPLNSLHAEDVKDLRSTISNLELKINEADKIITILREETSQANQERDRLQHEIIPLRRKAAAKGRAGFPPLFVVFIWIVGIFLGCLFHP